MGRNDSASRVIAAPADRVFAALVDPGALAVWLPPTGMTGRFEHFDAAPGGSYRMVLTYDDASPAPGKASADADVVDVRFLDIIPGERVVQAVDFESDDPAFAGTMTMIWAVTATSEGTRVALRADDVPVGITAEDHAEGMASSLANLAAYTESSDAIDAGRVTEAQKVVANQAGPGLTTDLAELAPDTTDDLPW